MEYYDQEYLKLFKQVRETEPQMVETKDYTFEQLRCNANDYSGAQMLRETPNYSNYNNINNFNQNVNEVQRQNYSQDYNLNEFNIEARINGQNINEVRRQEKEDKLNEVMQKLREERLAAMKKEEETSNINEKINFKDVECVTLEMFNKARYSSMMQVAHRILPK